MDWSSTVRFCVIINEDGGCIWSRVKCMELVLRFYARMDSFHRKNYNSKQREEANEQNHYVVAILKRTVGCTENQGYSW